MILSGWGRYPRVECRVSHPQTISDLSCLVANNEVIARGNGRAYGDSAVNSGQTIDMRGFHQLLAFDSEKGTLTAGAGVQLRDIMETFAPRGWFLPVTPGTSYATLGGAIASDVHGKNHHKAGTFGQHVEAVTMMLGTGDIVTISPTQLPDLFHATCAGMGLTAIILSATIKLIPIRSNLIRQTTIKAGSLEQVAEQFDAHASATYSVAWIDCLASGASLGRSVLFLGEHEEEEGFEPDVSERLIVPLDAPTALFNTWTVKAFNQLYYARARHGKTQRIPLCKYFYPLDAIGDWNRLYGKEGFVQYQFVVPRMDGVKNMRTILDEISRAGAGSFLAVLKLFGGQNANLLSFPMAGYTLALDFKMCEVTRTLLKKLDDMVVGMGGRIYAAKDALMSERTFKASYPNVERFEAVREAYGAIGKFSSEQSRRLGLR